MKYKEYTDKKGRIIWAGQGIGDKAWFTCWCIPGKKGSHRLVSPDLPIRHNRKQAQDDLDTYAAQKNFKEYYRPPAPPAPKPAPKPAPEPIKEAGPRGVWTPPPKPFKDIAPWDNVKSTFKAPKKAPKPKLEQASLF